MATKLTSTLGSQQQPGVTISSRRGISAKGREKVMLANRDQQLKQQQNQGDNPQSGVTQGNEATNTMNQTKNLLTKRNKKPAYMQSLNEAEKAENFKIIDNMSKKITFLKNPRYAINKVPILMTQVSIYFKNIVSF